MSNVNKLKQSYRRWETEYSGMFANLLSYIQFLTQPGFLAVLFKITMMEEQSYPIRMCAVIYLKNTLSSWYEELQLTRKAPTLVNFSADEQKMFKENIINAMVNSNPEIR